MIATETLIGAARSSKSSPGWWLSMRWHDLLFAHWPVAASVLRPLIPPPLEIDTFDGSAWIGVVPFRMTHIHARWLPPVPTLSAFAETNLRTYVRQRGLPGVYFLSLDAPHLPAILTARNLFHLPYFFASVRSTCRDGVIHHRSIRRNNPLHGQLVMSYRPIGEIFHAAADTLDHFLTERYRLFVAHNDIRIWRGEIHHHPWPLQHAEAEFAINTLPQSFDIMLPDTRPVLHFAREIDTVAWLPVPA
jgi:uncharacterized protein